MEQLKALIEKAKSDEELMAKLDALGAKDAGDDEIIALAKEYGFTVTAEDIDQVKNESAGSTDKELTEEELEAVAGGGSENRYDPNTCKNMTKRKYECFGFLGLCWCDHYRKELCRKPDHARPRTWIYYHKCVMEAYRTYKGYSDGVPEK